MWKRILRSLALTLAVSSALAQIRLPAAPPLSQSLAILDRQVDDIASRTLSALSEVRKREVDQLIRNNRRRIDTDPHGNPIVRNEVLAWSPTEEALAHARSLGFGITREQSIESLQVRVVVLSAPNGVATRKALKVLREGDPGGSYDFNHIYWGSAAQITPIAGTANARSAGGQSSDAAGEPIRIGLLDTGINLHHPALDSARIVQWGCDGKPVPAAHGTAIASILIGRASGFRGVEPGAELYSADVYCGQPVGGAVDSIVASLGWLVGQNIPVINVSLVGPANFLLEHTIAALSARGFLIVAAVGNDGPAAPPLYPASYPGVVGVTAVDARQHVLIEAAHGPQVMFAAPGADMAAANDDDGYISVRGTSFASPIVAALLASRINAPDPGQVSAAIDALAKTATELGSPGRDFTYGIGLVGAEYRIDAANLIHR
ncbi:MAG TPA: S8 family serine peptidase [Steroidobacteraceae bacterium]|jgi:subtilisin family serine protease|nr:S8 family serine peptidase [Steroidobacteraceae bacterium]